MFLPIVLKNFLHPLFWFWVFLSVFLCTSFSHHIFFVLHFLSLLLCTSFFRQFFSTSFSHHISFVLCFLGNFFLYFIFSHFCFVLSFFRFTGPHNVFLFLSSLMYLLYISFLSLVFFPSPERKWEKMWEKMWENEVQRNCTSFSLIIFFFFLYFSLTFAVYFITSFLSFRGVVTVFFFTWPYIVNIIEWKYSYLLIYLFIYYAVNTVLTLVISHSHIDFLNLFSNVYKKKKKRKKLS